MNLPDTHNTVIIRVNEEQTEVGFWANNFSLRVQLLLYYLKTCAGDKCRE